MKNRHQGSSLELMIRRYYDGCNAADRALMLECLSEDAVHYFPAGAPQGPFRGGAAIADGWIAAVNALDSRWTIDSMLVDEARGEAVVEWTHFKHRLGLFLRGAEFFRFDDDGRISEIRAYYACPPASADVSYELGDFDYFERGIAVDAPDVVRVSAG
jgi:ketosteroid isomerase-like protein